MEIEDKISKERKQRLFNRALLVGGITTILTFAIYIGVTWRTPREFYIPGDFSGWATVRYEVKDAAPLEKVEGAYRIYLSDSGTAETSSKFMDGWGKDLFFVVEGDKATEMELVRQGANGMESKIHRRMAEARKMTEAELLAIPPNTDTTLWDGTEIERVDTTMEVRDGRKLFQHFYVTEDYEGPNTPLPELPPHRKAWK